MTRRDERSYEEVHRYSRMVRVNEVVREVVAEELERLSDPRLGFVTLSSVDVSGDLRHARAYYSVLGSDEVRAKTHAALAAATSRIQVALGRQVRLKYLPRLEFLEDPAIEQGRRVEEIIRDLHTDDVGGVASVGDSQR